MEMNGITSRMFIFTAACMKLRDCKIWCTNILHKTGNEIQFNRFLFYLILKKIMFKWKGK